MLSIGKLGAGPDAGRYYVEQVARGREDYYAGEGEAPGAWAGSGAVALRLSGAVDEREVGRLLAAEHPATGEALRRPLATGAVAGFDLTFRAPKSVGVLWGVADGDVAREVRLGHEAAVNGALAYLEREACRARRGAGGAVKVRGGGFVAAAFRHRSSRAGDPLLHTHVVVANATQGPDGRWTALDGRELYRHAKTAGFLYQAVLRAELSERLGVEWNEVENGTADLCGISRGVVEHFSERRREIVEHMRVRGESSARAAQVAALDTRRAKQRVPVDRLREDWRARAAEHGLDDWALRDVVDRAVWPEPEPEEVVAQRLEGHEGLTRERSTFTRRDVVQAFAEAARDGARVEVIERAADAFLTRAEVVELDQQAGEQRYSTRELLDIERDLLNGAEGRRGDRVGRAEREHVDAAVDERPALSAEQRAVVTELTRGPDGVQVVRAPAGAGKTFALDAAREAWQRSGVPVLGCALSARAACELRDQAAIDATTIAKLTHAFDRGAAVSRGGVLVVDEAGMVGTRDLARLAEAADQSESKLVLVGDDRQLPEIDAGGAYRALADRLGARELHEVRRQRHAWDRDALNALRDGHTQQFTREYHQHGRIVVSSTADEARDALVDDWSRSFERGEQALMIAHRRADVADLNERARERMRDAGRLGDDELRAADDRTFATGDRVVATRNDRRLGILNGQTGTLAQLRDDAVSVQLDDGPRVDLPRGYAEDGGLDHGYAITAHRAQGATVDRTFVLGSEGLYREWAYTALSRHRDEARFYVTATPTFLNRAPEPLRTDDDVAGAVTRMLDDSRAEHLASHGIVPDLRAEALGEDLDRVEVELADVEARLAELQDERDATRWYQRSRRDEIDAILTGHLRAQEYWSERLDDLRGQLASRPEPTEPPELWRAADPLATSDLELEADLAAPAPELDLDVGMDLGP